MIGESLANIPYNVLFGYAVMVSLFLFAALSYIDGMKKGIDRRAEEWEEWANSVHGMRYFAERGARK